MILAFLALIAVISVVCIWQRNNLKAIKVWLQSSQDEISTQMQDNQQKVVDVAQKVPGVTIHGVTEEQKQALRSPHSGQGIQGLLSGTSHTVR